MPFFHWETKSKQLDMNFFILLRLLLKLLQENKTAKSTDPLWHQLSSEDMKFLLDSLRTHWSTSLGGMDEMNAISSKLSCQGSGEIPMGNEHVAKEALELLSPWGLSEEDLEMFRAQPDGQEWPIANPKRSNCKSPIEVLESLQGCYDLILARDREKELVDGYVGDAHPLHIRRTLDQSHYYMLDNTRLRDRDQVVSRYGESHKTAQQHRPVVMMVDQLWLWMIEGNARTIRP
jgi:hypothetical protein